MSQELDSKYHRRITDEGAAILRDAFNQGMTRPTREQKEHLIGRINVLPGCEGYTVGKLTSLFGEWRHKSGLTEPIHKRMMLSPRKNDGTSSPTASLASDHIETLRILYEGTTHEPRQELVDTWARLLRVPSAEVTAWIRAEQLQREAKELRTELLLAMHHDVDDATTREPAPQSTEEFNKMFRPYGEMMKTFLDWVEREPCEAIGVSD
ncbi:hypothetical protein VNI00_004272 [Paramarasmius palmivorus]|uniref:Uncharacterized protein n=1 Tax=Paramarasmius palmivorus TaxID=297713 RepID=A0AAW0DMH9_9AGAR